MEKAKKAQLIAHRLATYYPDTTCPLNHQNTWQLLIATILSAQTTDAQVNKVTPLLFKKFPSLVALGSAKQESVEQLIKPVGLAPTKASYLITTAQKISAEFGGGVPQTITQLTTLPGVGRKVANVVLFHGFGLNQGFIVDTHVIRLANWFGLTNSQSPTQIEQDLMAVFEQAEWGSVAIRLIQLGRAELKARAANLTRWQDLIDLQALKL